MTVTFSQFTVEEIEITFTFKIGTYSSYKIKNNFNEISDAVTQRLKNYIGQDGVVQCDTCIIKFTK